MAICIQDTVEGMGIAIFWQLWKERKFSRFLTLYTMSFLFGGSKRFLVFHFSIIRPKESFFSVMNKNKNSRACLFEPVVHIQRYRSTYKHSHDSLIFSSYKCYKVNINHDWFRYFFLQINKQGTLKLSTSMTSGTFLYNNLFCFSTRLMKMHHHHQI